MVKPPEDSPPTERFSRRVDYYVRYRPHYPPAVIPYLEGTVGFSAATVIADIGSGTGILTRLFLDHGNPVYGVEPNAEMRGAAEKWLADYDRFTSVGGKAEATSLPDASVGLVTVGQAFHWFDGESATKEFRRILDPEGFLMLLYNGGEWEDGPEFPQAYEALWPIYGLDYGQVNRRRVTEREDTLRELFPQGYEEAWFDNPHWYTFEELKGRALSSSYVPLPGHPQYEPMLVALREVFDQYQEDGKVCFPYETNLVIGRI